MRTYIRSKVDLDRPIQLEKLSPWERITTSFRLKFTQSRLYQGMLDKELEKEKKIRLQRIDDLKSMLLTRIDTELRQKSDRVERITIQVARGFDDIIDDVITSVDFYSFELSKRYVNPDFLLSFPELPILLDVKRRS
ncbi:hypothetical protein [Clostridium paraputrificum]|uniref:Uncharacterized protein n=1 Tax=Clostridium paraputrificum TaxID=29363 RepID=A0A6N3EZD5_9CLOT